MFVNFYFKCWMIFLKILETRNYMSTTEHAYKFYKRGVSQLSSKYGNIETMESILYKTHSHYNLYYHYFAWKINCIQWIRKLAILLWFRKHLVSWKQFSTFSFKPSLFNRAEKSNAPSNYAGILKYVISKCWHLG